MATKTKVMTSVSSMFDFTKTHVSNLLTKASNDGILTLDEKNLEAVINMVQAGIGDAFVRSSNEVINSLENLENSLKTSKRTK